MRRAVVLLLLLPIIAAPIAAQSKKFKAPEIALDVSLVALGYADLSLSIHGIKYHGLVETNGLMAPLFEREQYAALFALQTAGSLAIVALCHSLIAQNSRTAKFAGYAMLAISVAARAYVVVHNARLNARTPHL